jgi:acetyl esterase/lipase
MRFTRRNLLSRGGAISIPALVPASALYAAVPPSPPSLLHVDPEMARGLRGASQTETNAQNLARLRANGAAKSQTTAEIAASGGAMRWETLPGPTNHPALPALVYDAGVPSRSKRPAVLWIHGGGFVSGHAEVDAGLREIAQRKGWLIVSPEYRLAPEARWHDSLSDNYAALRWIHDNADKLGVDRSRIAIGGGSAGGGHAALLALKARDEGEISVRHQVLIYPMLDDRTGSTRLPRAGIGELLWTAASNRFGWGSFLGMRPGSGRVPSAAVPARRNDLAGLPPAFVGVGGLDLFLDEDIDYATALKASGVATDLVVVPGAYHGFRNIAGAATASRAFNARWLSFLEQGLA